MKTLQEIWPAPFSYETFGTQILDANGTRMLDVRSWGYLTGGGGAALSLPLEEAAAIQDAMAARVVAILNKHWNDPTIP